jgi:TPR repeat protein
MYANGHGVAQDHAEALKWYRLAADQGYADAQYNLGVLYKDGHGEPQDYAEALKWFSLAANQGDPVAQNGLGFMYANGKGVPQDFVLAHMWWSLASTRGNEDAAVGRDQIAARMAFTDVEKAQRLAREWLEKHQKAR